MTPEEKMIQQLRFCIRDHVEYRLLNTFDKILEDYEATPKTWTPPWPMKIPDWPEVWLCVNPSGFGYWCDIEPVESPVRDEWTGSNKCKHAGLFEIPPGLKWPEMKVKIK